MPLLLTHWHSTQQLTTAEPRELATGSASLRPIWLAASSRRIS
jgi:hypothetical protein